MNNILTSTDTVTKVNNMTSAANSSRCAHKWTQSLLFCPPSDHPWRGEAVVPHEAQGRHRLWQWFRRWCWGHGGYAPRFLPEGTVSTRQLLDDTSPTAGLICTVQCVCQFATSRWACMQWCTTFCLEGISKFVLIGGNIQIGFAWREYPNLFWLEEISKFVLLGGNI